MEFSIRDRALRFPNLRSASGQGIIEYLLVLVVTIAIILGGLYQLNGAFKTWAQAYFGDYIACLLETGELPAIGATPGDSGVCNQFFKEFSFDEGRPLLAKGTAPPTKTGGGSGGGSRERSRTGSGGSGTYNSAGGGGRLPLGGGGAGGATLAGKGAKARVGEGSGTGNTSASTNEAHYAGVNRRLDTRTKTRLDNRFAFEQESEEKQKRKALATSRSTAGEQQGGTRISLKVKPKLKVTEQAEDQGMTFGNFIRFLIIAAIIVALVVFIGGQMLQIGKSME